MENTPQSDRPRIVFLGRRNAGKSSLVNRIAGQQLALVSQQKGTTTDPVLKSMELAPAGPVLLVDTPGLDDTGTLGRQRVEKAWQQLNRASLAVLVVDGQTGLASWETAWMKRLKERKTPFIVVRNKADLPLEQNTIAPEEMLAVSAKTGEGVEVLRLRIAEELQKRPPEKPILRDLIQPGDFVVLVTPIDAGAPKGRLILPQQQTIREILDSGAIAVTAQPEALAQALSGLARAPKLVVTDSQAFGQVAKIVPQDVPLTSFSILFARKKGELAGVVSGTTALQAIQTGDTILIAEGCTHHRQCDDIGTVKLPGMLRKFTGVEPVFEFCSGYDFPQDLRSYKAIVHCGACMLDPQEVANRQQAAKRAGIPFTNYGVAMAAMTGILQRSIAMFPEHRQG